MNKFLMAAILAVLVGLLCVISTALQPAKEASSKQKYNDMMKSQEYRFKQEDMDRKQRKAIMEELHKRKGVGSNSELKPEDLNGMGAGKGGGYMESDWAAKRADGQDGLKKIGPKSH